MSYSKLTQVFNMADSGRDYGQKKRNPHQNMHYQYSHKIYNPQGHDYDNSLRFSLDGSHTPITQQKVESQINQDRPRLHLKK